MPGQMHLYDHNLKNLWTEDRSIQIKTDTQTKRDWDSRTCLSLAMDYNGSGNDAKKDEKNRVGSHVLLHL